MLKQIGALLLTAIILAFSLELGEKSAIPGVHSFFARAEAIVGRPLTPMSTPASREGPRGGVQRVFITARSNGADLATVQRF
jgi:hypothetical protein